MWWWCPELSGVLPVNGGGRIHPIWLHFHTARLHFSRSKASSFSNPNFFTSSSTFLFHVLFGRPLLLLPITSKSRAFLKMLPSSLLSTWPYHLTAFAFAIISNDSTKPNISINSFVIFLSINLTPHMALNIALSVLLKIATSPSVRHHVSLPYRIAERTQLWYTLPFILSENLLP